jgi:hypothetical protein
MGVTYDSGLQASDEKITNAIDLAGITQNKWKRYQQDAIPGTDRYVDFGAACKVVLDWNSSGLSNYDYFFIGMRVDGEDTLVGFVFKIRKTATILFYVGLYVIDLTDGSGEYSGTVKFSDIDLNIGPTAADFQGKGFWFEFHCRNVTGDLKTQWRYAKAADPAGKTMPSMSSWVINTLTGSQFGDWLPGKAFTHLEIWRMSDAPTPNDDIVFHVDLAQIRFQSVDLTF